MKEDSRIFYTPKNEYVRNFIKQTVHGGRVLAGNKNIVPTSFTDVGKVSEEFYGKDLKVSVLFDKYSKHMNTIQNYYKEKYEARFGDYRRINKKIENYIKRKVSRIPVWKQLAAIDKIDLLVSSDYNSL